MFGIVPEEQVEWTKEPIAHKADQSLLQNKLIKLNLLNIKINIFFNTTCISNFVGILDLGDLQYFVHFHDYDLPVIGISDHKTS